MLSDGKIDAVHVLLPPALHAQAAGEIVAAGVDVLLEKPMGVSAPECESLIERARSSGIRLGVGHNFLFAPVYEALKKDLAAGRLGRPDEVTITWNKGLGQLQSGPFDLWMLREPGNIMLEVGSHSVAHMHDLVGPVEMLQTAHFKPGGPARRHAVFPPMACGRRPAGRSAWRSNFSFAAGFSEHTIHVSGSLAAATVDFERNTYLLHRHTPSDMDFDRYHMTVADGEGAQGPGQGHAGPVDLFRRFGPPGALRMARASLVPSGPSMQVPPDRSTHDFPRSWAGTSWVRASRSVAWRTMLLASGRGRPVTRPATETVGHGGRPPSEFGLTPRSWSWVPPVSSVRSLYASCSIAERPSVCWSATPDAYRPI